MSGTIVVRSILTKFGFQMTGQRALADTDRRLGSAKKRAAGLGSALKGAAAALGAFALARMAIDAVDKSLEFNRQMGQIQTLIPGASARVNELRDDIHRLSVETGQGTSDMANGVYQLISALGDATDTTEKMDIAARAAAAGNSTVEQSIDLLTAVTKGYGDTSAQAFRDTADLAFMTVKLGKTNFPELARSVGGVIPLMVGMGVAAKEGFGIIAAATGTTGNTSEVTTQLASALGSLQKQTKPMEKAIRQLGFTEAKTMVQQLGLVGSFKALIGTTDGTQEAMAKLFQRKEAMILIQQLLGASSGDLTMKMGMMDQATGSMAEAAIEAKTGLAKTAFEAKVMQRQAEVLTLKIGDGLAPTVLGLKLAFMEAALTLSDDLLPMFSELNTESETSTGFLQDAATAVGVLVKGLVAAYRTAKMVAGVLGAEGAWLGARVVGGGTESEADAIDLAAAENIVKEYDSWKRDLGVIGQSIMEPEAMKERARLRGVGDDARTETGILKREATDKRISDIKTLIGKGVEIANQTIIVPPGTSPDAAKKIVADGQSSALDSFALKLADVFGS